MLNKVGTPHKLSVIKQSAFDIDTNVLVSVLKDKYPSNSLSLDELHEVLKSLGIVNYKSEDMAELVGRLHAVGIKVTENV